MHNCRTQYLLDEKAAFCYSRQDTESLCLPVKGEPISKLQAVVRMENGKIAEERDFLDNLELMQQLELIPR